MNTFVIFEFIIVVLLFCFMASFCVKQRNIGATIHESLIPIEASHLLKATACLTIVMHHFGLRQAELLHNMVVIGGGNWALIIFMILSAYGITKSEKAKPLNVRGYISHRVLKLLKPFWIASFVITILYIFTAPSIDDIDIITNARLGTEFPAIGRGEYAIVDYMFSTVGLRTISASHWFVHVTLYSYVLFLVLKETITLNRRLFFLCMYIGGLAAFAMAMQYIDVPAHYWRDLWALPFGLALALFEKEIIGNKKMLFLMILIADVFLFSSYIMHFCHGRNYFIVANLVFASMVAIVLLFKKYEFKKQSNPVIFLSGISYMVYLIHGAMLNEQWLIFGRHNSLIMVVATSIIMAYILNAPISLKRQ